MEFYRNCLLILTNSPRISLLFSLVVLLVTDFMQVASFEHQCV